MYASYDDTEREQEQFRDEYRYDVCSLQELRMFAEPEREFQVIVRDCTPLDDLRGLEAAECHDIKDYRNAEQLQVLTVHSFNYART